MTNPSPSIESRINFDASSISDVTTTPFPDARTSLLMTHGGRFPCRKTSISECSSNLTESAVGMPNFPIRSFAWVFDPSNIAPFAPGPKVGIPISLNLSEIPATRGPSGPTTTKSADISCARDTNPSISMASISWCVPRIAVPALPGAVWIDPIEGLWDRPIAKACSLPPEPIISTDMDVMVARMARNE